MLFIWCFQILSCVSNPTGTSQQTEVKKQIIKNKTPDGNINKPSGVEALSESKENIDIVSLQKYLNMHRQYNQLGYSERIYNTCQVGFGYSATENCKKKYLVLSQFQLMCRNSEGTLTESISQSDLMPIARQNIKWKLKNAEGVVTTDNQGYAQILMISDESQKMQRLKLNLDNDFLFLKAGELTQMITPQSWCRP